MLPSKDTTDRAIRRDNSKSRHRVEESDEKRKDEPGGGENAKLGVKGRKKEDRTII